MLPTADNLCGLIEPLLNKKKGLNKMLEWNKHLIAITCL
jgi:hypothetical protein